MKGGLVPPIRRFLQEPHGVTCKKAPFLKHLFVAIFLVLHEFSSNFVKSGILPILRYSIRYSVTLP
jgi:hypothetical protein